MLPYFFSTEVDTHPPLGGDVASSDTAHDTINILREKSSEQIVLINGSVD